MVSFCVVYFVLFVTIGITFCSEIRPVLGWKSCGKISWKGRVLSGAWGWEFGAKGLGIYGW